MSKNNVTLMPSSSTQSHQAAFVGNKEDSPEEQRIARQLGRFQLQGDPCRGHSEIQALLIQNPNADVRVEVGPPDQVLVTAEGKPSQLDGIEVNQRGSDLILTTRQEFLSSSGGDLVVESFSGPETRMEVAKPPQGFWGWVLWVLLWPFKKLFSWMFSGSSVSYSHRSSVTMTQVKASHIFIKVNGVVVVNDFLSSKVQLPTITVQVPQGLALNVQGIQGL